MISATVKNELDQLKASVNSLTHTGKYGEAVRLISRTFKENIYFMSSDRDDIRDFICGWMAGDACCNCCDSCSSNGCVGGYCLAFMAVFCCCGGDVAQECCGCNWAITESATCCREECFGL